MDGRFPSNGPVWRLNTEPLTTDDNLTTMTRDALERAYNNEMTRRRNNGDLNARVLTSTWDKKPKIAIEQLVANLIADGAQLYAPPVLNAESRPTLAKGTRLVARTGDSGDRRYAVVDSTTPSGILRLRLFENATVEHSVAVEGALLSQTRVTRLNNKPYKHTTLAKFEPSVAPDLANHYGAVGGDHWVLKTNNDSVFGSLTWGLEPVEDGPNNSVEWLVRYYNS